MVAKKAIAIGVVAVVVVAAVAAGAALMLNNNKDNTPTLTIASSPFFCPYDYYCGTEWAGIDMDICIAVCNEIGYKCNFVQCDFKEIIAGIEAGKFDMGASGFSITPERGELVLFSDSYAEVVNVIVVPKDSPIDTFDKAKEAKSGAQTGTTGSDNARSAGFDITDYDRYTDVFQNLKQKNIDCMVLDYDTALSFVQNPDNGNNYKILKDGSDNLIKVGNSEKYAFTFKLSNTELRDKFNDGLKTITDNGTLKKINDYYVENLYSAETPSYWTTH